MLYHIDLDEPAWPENPWDSVCRRTGPVADAGQGVPLRHRIAASPIRKAIGAQDAWMPPLPPTRRFLLRRGRDGQPGRVTTIAPQSVATTVCSYCTTGAGGWL